ncbi:MAG: DUF1553 domain-containing protein [Planctomyces sp.]
MMSSLRRISGAILTASLFCGTLLFCSTIHAQNEIQYNRDVRPILVDACFACHGADSAARKGDLRLDQRDAAVQQGAIVPGKPDESEMIRRILSEDPESVMPPPEMKKTLTPAQKKILADWIQNGAEYQQHWSYLAPVRSAVPPVPSTISGQYSSWPKNAIDHFVLNQLAQNGLTPAEEADRRTLARRVSFDLTGLPPAPEMVQAFVDDQSPDAWEKLVDKLLDSPQWGEHRARYWLDYARYADTHGIHFDNYREIWAYRDWVIGAFNRNMPFDQFTIENLAGDLLPNATLDQKIASGFNRCNMTTNEGGIIDEEYAVLYTRDRTETVSAVWMGLTANCATCHSHKFDPISQKEFYQLAAFFNNTTQPVRDGNIRDTPPVIPVPQESERLRFEELTTLIETARASVEERRSTARSDFSSWSATATVEQLGAPVSSDAQHLHFPLDGGTGSELTGTFRGQPLQVTMDSTASWQEDADGHAVSVQGALCSLPDAGDFESNQPFSCSAWIKVPASDGTGAICARMEPGPGYRGWDFWFQQRRIGMHIVSSWPDQALKAVCRKQFPANEWVHVAVTWDGSRNASGLQIYVNGELQEKNIEENRLGEASIRTKVPWRLGDRTEGSPFTGSVKDLRIHERVLSPSEVDGLARYRHYAQILTKKLEERTEQETGELYEYWLKKFDAQFRERSAVLAAFEKEQADIRSRGTVAHVMNERTEAPMAWVLYRGEYDQRREQVSADIPSVFPAFPGDVPRNRLGFAKWLLRPDHPLTARVTVNRFWQEVFGTGIVRTTGDLGVSGELPTHPELLDWLAVEFRESGWDIRRLIRLMVTSATYRQRALVTPEKIEKDPENRLLSRGPRFRMDAEMVRDNALAVSGLLVPKIGGPSVRPYQPGGVWESIAMIGSTTQNYVRDSGENLYRRSLYTFVKRMAPPASLDIFNAPNREQCTVRRERTNTPLQALVTLNDEQFVEAARRLAENALTRAGQSDEERIQWVALRLMSREFRPDELAILKDSLTELKNEYSQQPADAAALVDVGESTADARLDVVTLAAWTMLCNEMMNLDEVLNK